MAAPAENAPATAADFSKMNKLQKLAALLIILGPGKARPQILKTLDEYELDTVTGEMSKLNLIGYDLQKEVLKEFAEVAITAGTSIRGGMDFTRAALERAVGLFKASDVMGPGHAQSGQCECDAADH